jgi:hypothetical protein
VYTLGFESNFALTMNFTYVEIPYNQTNVWIAAWRFKHITASQNYLPAFACFYKIYLRQAAKECSAFSIEEMLCSGCRKKCFIPGKSHVGYGVIISNLVSFRFGLVTRLPVRLQTWFVALVRGFCRLIAACETGWLSYGKFQRFPGWDGLVASGKTFLTISCTYGEIRDGQKCDLASARVKLICRKTVLY